MPRLVIQMPLFVILMPLLVILMPRLVILSEAKDLSPAPLQATTATSSR